MQLELLYVTLEQAEKPEVRAISPLWRRCQNVIAARDAFKLARPMIELMNKHGGVGLSANQVGYDIPLFVMKLGEEVLIVYRPLILRRSDMVTPREEGCLSFPGVTRTVFRPSWIEAEFIYQKNNKRRRVRLDGLAARIFEHEYDHLQGCTILEKGLILDIAEMR